MSRVRTSRSVPLGGRAIRSVARIGRRTRRNATCPSIVATACRLSRAAQEATSTIPINRYASPIQSPRASVASFARPGGNLTGVSSSTAGDLAPKRLEMLPEMVPKAEVIAGHREPRQPDTVHVHSRGLKAAARVLKSDLYIVHATTAKRDR